MFAAITSFLLLSTVAAFAPVGTSSLQMLLENCHTIKTEFYLPYFSRKVSQTVSFHNQSSLITALLINRPCCDLFHEDGIRPGIPWSQRTWAKELRSPQIRREESRMAPLVPRSRAKARPRRNACYSWVGWCWLCEAPWRHPPSELFRGTQCVRSIWWHGANPAMVRHHRANHHPRS